MRSEEDERRVNAAQSDKNEALRTLNAAREEHSEESKIFYKLRHSIPPKELCDPVQLALLEHGRFRYKAACKRLQEARDRHALFSNPEAQQVKAQLKAFQKQLNKVIDGLDLDPEFSADEVEEKKQQYENDPILQEFIKKQKLAMEAERKPPFDGMGVKEKVENE